MIKYIYMILFPIGTLTLFISILGIFDDNANRSIHKKRKNQLRGFDGVKNERTISDLIEQITNLVEKHIFSNFKPKGLDEIEKDLKMAKWDKYFTPIQFKAIDVALKISGLFIVILLGSLNKIFIAWGLPLIILPNQLLQGSITARKNKLLNDFPDFIRITQGYLYANIPLYQAVEEAIEFVGEEWKPILKAFILDIQLKDINEALDNLKKEVDIFEVKEFVALVKLTFEQGGDAKKSFGDQADRIRKIQQYLMETKIEKRKSMTYIVQAPIMITNIILFGLPVADSIMNLTTM